MTVGKKIQISLAEVGNHWFYVEFLILQHSFAQLFVSSAIKTTNLFENYVEKLHSIIMWIHFGTYRML
jgi:hypothetical protein